MDFEISQNAAAQGSLGDGSSAPFRDAFRPILARSTRELRSAMGNGIMGVGGLKKRVADGFWDQPECCRLKYTRRR